MLFLASKNIEKKPVSVVLLREEGKVLRHPFYRVLNDADKALIDRFLAATDLKKSPVNTLFLPSGSRILIIGTGDKNSFTAKKVLLAMRQVIAAAKKAGIKNVQVYIPDFVSKDSKDLNWLAESFATQAELANFEFVVYKTSKEDKPNFVEKVLVYAERNPAQAQKYLDRGKIVGEEMNAARTLANTPAGDMTPEGLAKAAEAAAKANKISIKVLEEDAMRRLGMGGVLGVGQGASAKPRFIVMEYWGASKREPPVVLVGKGITFDSGGINIKPERGLHEMHMDMSGGAAVIHTVTALARLKARKNIIGLIPAAENMVSGASYRPGDVLKTMGGKTIEVGNTDAEGRIVLADGLEYAKKYKPRLVIDAATLTGAALVALGQRASAMFSTERRYENLLREIGERTGDPVWPMPLWEEFEEELKANFGDLSNIGKYDRIGGLATSAVFLWQFIKPIPWVHLDIAPRMTSMEGDNLAKGSIGAPVNLLVHFLEKF